MKRNSFVAVVAGHVLWGVGHIVSRPMVWFGWAWLYPAYNWCMVTSSDMCPSVWGMDREEG